MDIVPVRELQQHASAVLRRVRAGETVGVTDRGILVAVITPPDNIGGAAGLLAAGRVRPARRTVSDLRPPSAATSNSRDVLDDLRADR